MFGGMFGSIIGGTVIALTGTRGIFAFAGVMMFALIPLIIWAAGKIQKAEKQGN